MSTATVTYTAELRSLREQFKQLPEDQRQSFLVAVRELDKSVRAVERAQTKAIKSAKDMAQATDAAGTATRGMGGAAQSAAQQLPDVISQLSAGTSAAQVFAQQGLQVVQVHFSQFVAAVKAAPGPLAAVGVAVGALGLAYSTLAREQEQLIEIQDLHRTTGERLEVSERRLVDVRLDLAHATGVLTDAELRRAKAEVAAQQAVIDAGKAQREQRAEIRAGAEDAQRMLDLTQALVPDFLELANVGSMAADAVFGWSDKIEHASDQLAILDAQLVQEAAVQKDTRRAMEELGDAREKDTRRIRGQSAASRDAAEAERAAARAYAEAVRDRARAVEDLADITQAATLATLDEEGRLVAEYDLQLQRIAELEAATWDLAAAEQARAAVGAQHEQALGELRARQAEERAREEEAARAAQARAAKEQLDRVTEASGYIAQGLEAVSASAEESASRSMAMADQLTAQLAAGEEFYSAAQKAELTKRIEAQRDAAEKAWRREKNAARAAALINTAVAITKASTSAPWPWNLVPMAGAAAANIPHIAAVEAQNPTFHSGGAPDEIGATLLRQEYVSTPVGRSVLGDDTLRRADAGIAPERAVYAVSVYRHDRVVTRWEEDRLAMGGPVDAAIRSTQRRSGAILGLRSR